jgi:membrane-bound lytic murein transglycosylase B
MEKKPTKLPVLSFLFCLLWLFSSVSVAVADPKIPSKNTISSPATSKRTTISGENKKDVSETRVLIRSTTPIATSNSPFRGWDWLVTQLLAHGTSPRDVEMIYGDPRFPSFTFVPFSPNPKEAHSIYSGFLRSPTYTLGATFARQYAGELDRMERSLKVPREVVVAILVIESQLGKNTGDHMVLYRLSRIATVGEPKNVERNFRRLKPEMPSLTLETLEKRAKYLQDVFLPEIPALIEIGKRNKIDPLNVRGSIAGAFGMPQFLPSAFLKFGIDGDRNGYVSLFNDIDAIWSTGNYLASYGYRAEMSLEQRRAIIWKYNKSDAYIDTVLAVATEIRKELR